VVIIVPLIAILAVISEWSQRTGLTTFTLIPHRSRITRQGDAGEQWANIGVTGIVWLVIPPLVGLRLVTRAEVR
jgi:hypothetical protein